MNTEVLGAKISKLVGKWVDVDAKTERSIDNLQRLHQNRVQIGLTEDQRMLEIENYLRSHPEVNIALSTFFQVDATSSRFNYLADSASVARLLRDIGLSCFSTEIVQYVQSKFYVRAQLSFIPKTNIGNIRYGVKVDNGQFFESAEGMVAELFKRFPNEIKGIKNILEQFLKELAGSTSWCKEQEMLNAIKTFQTNLEQEIVKLV